MTFYRLIDSKQAFCNPAWWMHTHSRQSQFPAWSRITEGRLSVKEIDSETEHRGQRCTYSCLARSFVRSFVSLGIPSGRNSSSRLASRWEPRKREREREREFVRFFRDFYFHPILAEVFWRRILGNGRWVTRQVRRPIRTDNRRMKYQKARETFDGIVGGTVDRVIDGSSLTTRRLSRVISLRTRCIQSDKRSRTFAKLIFLRKIREKKNILGKKIY